MTRLISPLLALLTYPFSSLLMAAESDSAAIARTMPDPMSLSAVGQMLMGLLFVIGVILALSWAVKRARLLPGQKGSMQVVSVLPLGPKDKLVLVQAGESQLLLGVSSQQISLIKEFETPIAEPGQAPAGVFAKKLQEYIKERGDHQG